MQKRHVKPWPADKNTLSPYALRARDIRPGLAIVVFHINYGITERGTFVSSPTVVPNTMQDGRDTRVVATIRRADGTARLIDLADNGIVKYDDMQGRNGTWNSRLFTVAARKEHLLPEPTPDRQAYKTQSIGYVDYSNIARDTLGPLEDGGFYQRFARQQLGQSFLPLMLEED